MPSKEMRFKKALIIRLSSFGDLVLASSVLSLLTSRGYQVDWLVAKEYAALLQGHPDLNHVYVFDRRAGFCAWLKLCYKIFNQDYVLVLDLHRNLRAAMAVILFRFMKLLALVNPQVQLKRVSKQRLRLWALFFFKARFLPARFHPQPWLQRYRALLDSPQPLRPDLRFLVSIGENEFHQKGESTLASLKSVVALMPSARWPSKQWSLDRFVEIARDLRKKGYAVMVMGLKEDLASLALVARLKADGIDAINGVGIWSLAQTAAVLQRCLTLVSNDTGLAHLAESLGLPVTVIYGPTHSAAGFAPWQNASHVMGAKTWCRPCSKDGSFCWRIFDRYRCWTDLDQQWKDQGKNLQYIDQRPPT